MVSERQMRLDILTVRPTLSQEALDYLVAGIQDRTRRQDVSDFLALNFFSSREADLLALSIVR